ncbi:MAG: OB-fold nucleic acid binding domain-containing protein [Butyricicoccaceae bacterium]
MNNTSIAGMKRTHMCGELRLEHAGQTVTVNGWVDRVRDNGGVLFLLLRDRAGIVQCTFDKSVNADLFDIAFTCRTEFVVAVEGKLVARDAAGRQQEDADRRGRNHCRGHPHPVQGGDHPV